MKAQQDWNPGNLDDNAESTVAVSVSDAGSCPTVAGDHGYRDGSGVLQVVKRLERTALATQERKAFAFRLHRAAVQAYRNAKAFRSSRRSPLLVFRSSSEWLRH